jgi:hypothetical protein
MTTLLLMAIAFLAGMIVVSPPDGDESEDDF